MKQARASGGKGVDWRLTRFLFAHLCIGAISGWIFVAALIIMDVGGLGTLVRASSVGPLAVVMLLAVMTITWGAGSMGTAVFLLPRDDDFDQAGKGGRLRSFALLRPAARTAPARATVRPR